MDFLHITETYGERFINSAPPDSNALGITKNQLRMLHEMIAMEECPYYANNMSNKVNQTDDITISTCGVLRGLPGIGKSYLITKLVTLDINKPTVSRPIYQDVNAFIDSTGDTLSSTAHYYNGKQIKVSNSINRPVVFKTYDTILRPTVLFIYKELVDQWRSLLQTHSDIKVKFVSKASRLRALCKLLADVRNECKEAIDKINSYHMIIICNDTVGSFNEYPGCTSMIDIFSMASRDICWRRCVFDNYDVLRVPTSTEVIPALFTWFVISTNFVVSSLNPYMRDLPNNELIMMPSAYTNVIKLFTLNRFIVEGNPTNTIDTSLGTLIYKKYNCNASFDLFKKIVEQMINSPGNNDAFNMNTLNEVVANLYISVTSMAEIISKMVLPKSSAFIKAAEAANDEQLQPYINIIDRIIAHLKHGECVLTVTSFAESFALIITNCCGFIMSIEAISLLFPGNNVTTKCPNCRANIAKDEIIYVSTDNMQKIMNSNPTEVINDIYNILIGPKRPIKSGSDSIKYKYIRDIILGNPINATPMSMSNIGIPYYQIQETKSMPLTKRKYIIFTDKSKINDLISIMTNIGVTVMCLDNDKYSIADTVKKYALAFTNPDSIKVLIIIHNNDNIYIGFDMHWTTDIIFLTKNRDIVPVLGTAMRYKRPARMGLQVHFIN